MKLRWSPAHAAHALLRHTLTIADEETSCAARGFRVEGAARRERLDAIGRSFAAGYRAGLAAENLAPGLDHLDSPMRGFAYEGAAMALALRDRLQPFQGDRARTFLTGAGSAYRHLVHAGVGWARARRSSVSRRCFMAARARGSPWLGNVTRAGRSRLLGQSTISLRSACADSPGAR